MTAIYVDLYCEIKRKFNKPLEQLFTYSNVFQVNLS